MSEGKPTEHDVYTYLIGIGMPEGLGGEAQCMWLREYHAIRLAEIDRLREENERLKKLAGPIPNATVKNTDCKTSY